MNRQTKIVVTLGPATDSPEVLGQCLDAGLNVARLNFSHAQTQAHAKRVVMLRQLANERGMHVALMADLQGPKIRIGAFRQGRVQLEKGQSFVIDTALDLSEGDQTQVGVDYPLLIRDVKPGRVLLLDDGRIQCEVVEVQGTRVSCLVLVGGTLKDHKGINLQGGGLSADVITSKDRSDLHAALAMGVDYIALSFARYASDVEQIKRMIAAVGSGAQVIVKVERTEAVEHLDSLVDAADGVMVARGDLAVEVGDAEVPVIQKRIIGAANRARKPVIIATQMMESMIEQVTPTRAEVSDVANAVLDGADAVMLSAETAVGAHPAVVVEAMARCCLAAERPAALGGWHRFQEALQTQSFARTDQAIAGAAMYLANRLPVRAIVTLTESGATARWMSKFSSEIPVIALSRHAETLRRVQLYVNVIARFFDVENYALDEIDAQALACCSELGWLKSGDCVVLTRGDMMGVGGLTNGLKVCELP